MTQSLSLRIYRLLLIGVMGALLAATAMPSSTQATLPPRPTPPPAKSPEPDDRESKNQPLGGHIKLQVQPALPGAWTVVQWQDGLGDWHNVEGWQGTLDEGTRKVWWVAQADFGKGPFRWLVHQDQTGRSFAESETFYLPRSANETVSIKVTVAGF